MKKIKKTNLSQDETPLAIKLTHRARNPENIELEPEIMGYPFLIGLKTPLTCEDLYREVYVVHFLFLCSHSLADTRNASRYARTRHLHEMKGEFSECFFVKEDDSSTSAHMFQLFLSDENGIVNQDTEALPISSRPFRGHTSLNLSILWTNRAMWYKSRGSLSVIRRDESASEVLNLPKWLEPCGQIVNGLKCPKDHHVLSYRNTRVVLCDHCKQLIKNGRRMRGCRVCDWDVCAKCASGMMSKGRSKTSPTRSPLLCGQLGGPVDALPFTNTTLEHCFELWGKEESLGDSWRCPDCKIPVSANKRLSLTRPPRILIVQLKRFLYSNGRRYRMNTVVKIPRQNLDLSSFLSLNEEEVLEDGMGAKDTTDSDERARTPSPFLSVGSTIYDLKAVANHFGGISGGHYTACVYNPEAKEWFCFDDASVTPCNIDAVLCSPAPYILFYERRVK